eukprot:TRINITY_DN461_c0_g1_i19.p1 TRINITY_DN461_c0_g1~~TRINITY_DN461_c0_g1_i19.p1  ORF type:complete len:387 (+),score=92.88 TRINITY_DN461_c0_g1_i19:130-1290(+)
MTFTREGFTDGGVLSVFGLNCAIAAGLIITFSIVRRMPKFGHLFGYKTQTKDGYNTLSSSVNHGDDKESDSLRANAKGPAASVPAASLKSVLEIGGVTAWVWNTLRVKEEEILERCGFDAMIYLRFQRKLINFVFIVALLCGAVLVPINNSGDANLKKAIADDLPYWTGFNNWTTANINTKSDKLWAHLAVFVIVSVAFYSFIIRFLLNFDKSRRHFMKFHVDDEVSLSLSLSLFKDFSVLIRRLPFELRKKKYLIDHFEKYLYPKKVQNVELYFELEALRKHVTERENLEDLLDHYRGVLEKEGERPRIRAGAKALIGQVDAIEYYEKELSDLDKKIIKELERNNHPTTGVAVVTFKSQKTAKQCVQNFSFKREETQISGEAGPM